MAAIGSGLGSGGFIVFDDSADMVAVAAGVSRFLAVESCGQCVPCKADGLELADTLARMCVEGATDHDVAEVRKRAATVADRARCFLATQHQNVVTSLLECFPDEIRAHADGRATPTTPGDLAVAHPRQAQLECDAVPTRLKPHISLLNECSMTRPARLGLRRKRARP